MKYVLASASPRRKELLTLIINEFEVIPSNAPEILPNDIKPLESSEYLAKIKAKDIAKNCPDKVVIGADTAVILDDKILGKPKDRQDAFNMLKELSGNKHLVVTGCAIIKGNSCDSFSVVTEVEFFDLTDDEINAYLDTNESFDKAGSYGIQGKGALLVKSINGDYFNVVGLPVAELSRKLLK